MENLFFELLLPKTKPIVVGTIITNQTKQLVWRFLTKTLSKVDTNIVEIYIFADFNTNLWQNGHYVFHKHNLLSFQSVPYDVKNDFGFCTMFGLK